MRTIPFILIVMGIFSNFSAHADSIGFSIAENTAGDFKITVVDDSTLEPIQDALITFSNLSRVHSENPDAPDPTSTSFSDHEGTARIRLPNSRGQALTVMKSGYAAITLVGVRASKITLLLKPFPDSVGTVIASGTSTGWGRADSLLSKPVLMGLVFRTFKTADLLHFGADLLISPLRDTVDIWGKRNIPSNLVAPEQNVPILFGSVKINKPDYRLPLPTGKPSRLVLAQAQMDSGDLVSIAQGGKAGFDAFNKVQFDRLGLTETLTPTEDFKFNIDASYALTSSQTVRVAKPPFVSDVVVASVLDIQGDRQYLVPTDLKTPITSKNFHGDASVTLRSAASLSTKKKAVFALAITQDSRRFSGILASTTENHLETGEFLNTENLADSPQLPNQVTLEAPQSGIAQAVFQSPLPGDPKRTSPLWYIFSFPSAGSVSIATATMPFQQKVTQYTTSRLEFDSSFDERSVNGHTLINHVKRFASSLADIKNP